MSAVTDTTALDRSLRQPSLAAAFLARAAETPERIALRQFGSDQELTFGEWSERARAVAGGLVSLGIEPGDRVALLLTTRLDFHIADIGVLLAGAIPFSFYVTSSVSQLAEIVANAEPRVLITEAFCLDKARELLATCPGFEHLVVVEEGAARQGELTLGELEALCPQDFDAECFAAGAERDDICTLLYTSGTTGAPKGVQYRHGAVLACLDSFRQRFPVPEGDRALSYLPMAHIAERLFGHYAAFVYGYEVTSLADPGLLPTALRAVRPTRFFGVPRIFEKLLAAMRRHIAESPDRVRLNRALAARLAHVQAEQAGMALPADDEGPNRSILRPVLELTGLEDAHFVLVGGAPNSIETLEELTALGLPINDLYGLSETIAISVSPPGRVRLGTVGTPLPGVRVRLADDGEVLVAGSTVTPGYFRDPTRTAEVLDADGWFHTGDIGEIDGDGYIRIVDRKKALIINSGGKNMSPANIEQAIKGGQPLISQVYAYGDRRPYNVALVVLDRDGLATFARDHGLGEMSYGALTRRPEVLQAVAAAVEQGNQRLSRIEQIKRFRVLDQDWLPGSDELTPTAKLKRREIAAKYASVIDSLYEASP